MTIQNQTSDTTADLGYVDPAQAASNHFDAIRGDAAKAVEEALAAEAAKAPPALEPADDPEAPDEPVVTRPRAQRAPVEETEEETEEDATPPANDRSIARIFKQREKAAVVKTDAQKALEESRAALAEMKREREVLAKEREEIARDRAKIAKLKNVQNAPEALKEMGWEADDFIAAAARAKTPEGRLEALILAQKEEIDSLKAKADGWEKQGEEQRASAQKQADESKIREIESNFIKTAIDPKKYPSLAKRYAKARRHETLLFEAHKVARDYRLATGGDEADFDQLARYLEDEENGVDTDAEETEDAGKPKASTKGKGTAAGKPTGKRTLTSTDSSERRTVPAVDKTDDLDELRRRAKIAAEQAIRESA